jgi:(2R)-sulfolactate sulfo-lyase subunit alpha
MMEHHFLIHDDGDNVGVAVVDICKGNKTKGGVLQGNRTVDIEAVENIPLSHKIALKDLKQGDEIIKYGVVIGKASEAIAAGECVHAHNIKSVRWKYE